MPKYEYKCNLCHLHFEQKQSFNDEAVVTCPECGGRTARIIYPVPIIFIGDGFYTNEDRKGRMGKKT